MAQTRAAQLRDEIEDEIACGRFSPGERLDEQALAARFNVSRTPIREALRALSDSGLIEIRPHRGAIVASVAPAQVIEMFEVMAELEAMCGRLAARRLTAATRAAILAHYNACAKAASEHDTDAYYYANEGFHAAIYAAAGNVFLASEATRLQRKLQPYRRLQLRVRDRMAVSLAEHLAIVRAIEAGQAETAALNLRNHVLVQGERFSDLLASLASLHAA